MNVLIIYATHSGSNYFIAQIIKRVLESHGLKVDICEAHKVDADLLRRFKCIIMGSCTWDNKKKEGQLPELFENLVDKINNQSFPQTLFGIYGAGDASYLTFCGAVDHLENLVKKIKGKKIIDSLRIDRFYEDQNKKTLLVEKWAAQIADILMLSRANTRGFF